MIKTPASHRIALLFNANKHCDREIIGGIADYLKSTRASWELFIEEDFRTRLGGISTYPGDGIIANFDDPAVWEALANVRIPVVAVGSSYSDERSYPHGVPYVATDNHKLVGLAYDHLVDAGAQRFALFSVPETGANRWAQERELAFRQIMRRDRLDVEIYRGASTSARTWSQAVEDLAEWLLELPKPIGVIAVTDARARQLLQACEMRGIAVPEQVAIVGIDNDPLARMFTRISLSSVKPGTAEIGRQAAQLLHQMLGGARPGSTRMLVPPLGVNAQASTRHQASGHPVVMRGRHFIRQYACQGIKTEQVADYVGVSRSALDTHFRHELGHSVHGEILRHKLEVATRVLAARSSNIADVAVRCGFTSVQYMNAVFKRELHCTPGQYRERAAAMA